jgi:hypothetical protein
VIADSLARLKQSVESTQAILDESDESWLANWLRLLRPFLQSITLGDHQALGLPALPDFEADRGPPFVGAHHMTGENDRIPYDVSLIHLGDDFTRAVNELWRHIAGFRRDGDEVVLSFFVDEGDKWVKLPRAVGIQGAIDGVTDDFEQLSAGLCHHGLRANARLRAARA